MTERVCACGCGTPIGPERRADAIWATDGCAKRWKRANPGKKAPTAAQRAERQATARTRARKPVTFLVLPKPEAIDRIEARDRRAALRALEDLYGDGYVLVNERAVAHPK